MEILPIIVPCGMLIILCLFYIQGKKALKVFPAVDTVTILYRDKFASGNATSKLKYRFGGARNTLDIVVTDKELWIKSMTVFAGLLKNYGLLHKIPKGNVTNVVREGRRIKVAFITAEKADEEVVLYTKDADSFLRAINRN